MEKESAPRFRIQWKAGAFRPEAARLHDVQWARPRKAAGRWLLAVSPKPRLWTASNVSMYTTSP